MKLTNYKLISPPFTLEFDKMSKKELREFYKWYLDQIPIRMNILNKTIISTKGFKSWKPDYTHNSLEKLGEWFALHVETRKRTVKEIKHIYADSPEWFKNVEISDSELSNRTFSLAIDIGMYMCLVFLQNNSSLKWKHGITYSKRDIDYGKPVISGFGIKNFNPKHMIITKVYGFVRNNEKGLKFNKLYDVWIKLIE